MAAPSAQDEHHKQRINPGISRPNRSIFFIVSLAFVIVFLLSLSSEFGSEIGGGGVGGAGVEAAGENNVLAKHVAFFDINNDGLVYPWETFKGFRKIGCGLPLSVAAAFLINMSLSQKTRPGKFPSLLFPIEIKNIAKAKHGSDSGVYDTEGRFVPSKFEEIFAKHCHTTPDALTGEELKELLEANRAPKDFGGRTAAYTEWKILYNLCKDKNGLLHKQTVRAVYDGSLFEKLASEKASGPKKA